jgi:hypothetical protein
MKTYIDTPSSDSAQAFNFGSTAAGGVGACVKCGEQGYVMPLHGERGGPPFCFMCAGAWHAEHGRRRRAGRVVIKALRAYEATGGQLFGKDFDQLKLAAAGLPFIAGFEADTAGADFADLTSELLAEFAKVYPKGLSPEVGGRGCRRQT